jgi:hypothetical protein
MIIFAGRCMPTTCGASDPVCAAPITINILSDGNDGMTAGREVDHGDVDTSNERPTAPTRTPCHSPHVPGAHP